MDASVTMNWLANLSKLNFSDDELVEIKKDMVSIIALMDSILNIELHSNDFLCEGVMLSDLRKDIVTKSIDTATLYSQTNGQTEGCFSIPKIFE